MISAPDRELVTLSAGVQTPVLRADQLIVGGILTGPAWSTARIIEEIDGNTLVLVKAPRLPLPPGHLHAFTLHNRSECACGYRREAITGILPQRDNLARTYIISPIGPLVAPDRWTVYQGSTGRLLTFGTEWSAALPIIPLLHPIWTLPQALRVIAEARAGE